MQLSVGDDAVNDEVDNCKGKSNDNEANHAVKNGVFSLFDLASITGRGHISHTTDNDDNDSDDAKNANDCVQDIGNVALKGIGLVANLSWLYDFC